MSDHIKLVIDSREYTSVYQNLGVLSSKETPGKIDIGDTRIIHNHLWYAKSKKCGILYDKVEWYLYRPYGLGERIYDYEMNVMKAMRNL